VLKFWSSIFAHTPVKNLTSFCLSLQGLIADKTSSYPVAFVTAGGIEFLGLFVFAVCFCLKRGELSRKKIEMDPDVSSLNELLVVEKMTVL